LPFPLFRNCLSVSALIGLAVAAAAAPRVPDPRDPLVDLATGLCPFALVHRDLLGDAGKLRDFGYEPASQTERSGLATPGNGLPGAATLQGRSDTIVFIYPNSNICNVTLRGDDARARLDGFEAVILRSPGFRRAARSSWVTGPVRFEAFEGKAAKNLKIRIVLSRDSDPAATSFNLIQVDFR
jgi:hypothetical protein